MTPRQADKIIKEGKPVKVYNRVYLETFEAVFVKRGRYLIESEQGGLYDRADLELIAE